ncbi:hypothetical protein [Candidatus Chlamydia sanziniae]|uniref:Phenylalanine-4-hydroxylase n=1 Tax=Candidatus Chlamydia sanziniae TaxID=1806891 RepID=A0A1A9HV19_9CHLA|nr:hypothetical protein [Candidatus Chlamydia sanziniae]ANH78838.1 Phenylalanine-4-hydroxylase [Candidatus Chlamydia sanziniae]
MIFVFSGPSDKQQTLWSQLISSRYSLWRRHCPKLFFDYLETLGLLSHPVNGHDIATILQSKTGFSCFPIEGFEPPHNYLALLANKNFPIVTQLRDMKDDQFAHAPDMLHDLVGHVPWLLHPAFTYFFSHMGRIFQKAVTRARDLFTKEKRQQVLKSNLVALIRCFWFTVESGLIENQGKRQAYGAVLLGSPQELTHAFSKRVLVFPWCLDHIIHRPFDSQTLQTTLFTLSHFDQLIEITIEIEARLDHGELESIDADYDALYFPELEVLCS